MNISIPFNRPYLTGRESSYIADAHHRGQLAGDGFYTHKCHEWLENYLQCEKALLTHSCTAALEMAALLLDINPGDEVIMPSFTFVSTANAFVLRGAVPVFVDIRPDTLNIDERLISSAITDKTKAIIVVHYAGVACNMDRIIEIAKASQIFVVEDAAQALMSTYKNRPLGSIGDLACFSFHETKNIICGEGGALIVNNPNFAERAEIIREKGTNRSQFFRGQVDKYTWVDIGSSYLPGELNAAFLLAQLECASAITSERLGLWSQYQLFFDSLSSSFKFSISMPSSLPADTCRNGHIFYLLMENCSQRDSFIRAMGNQGIQAVFHYVPLHSAPAAKGHSRTSCSMDTTNQVSDTIVRLPLYVGLEIDKVFEALGIVFRSLNFI